MGLNDLNYPIDYTADMPGMANPNASNDPYMAIGLGMPNISQDQTMTNLLKLMGGGGLAGGPVGALIGLGGGILGGIGSYLAGGEQRAQRKKVFSLAENRLGQNILDPAQYLAQYQRAMVPEVNAMGEAMSQRTGLDSATAWGGLWDRLNSMTSKFYLEGKMRNDELKSQRDATMLNIMAQMTGG
jgi:hypothetical protein